MVFKLPLTEVKKIARCILEKSTIIQMIKINLVNGSISTILAGSQLNLMLVLAMWIILLMQTRV